MASKTDSRAIRRTRERADALVSAQRVANAERVDPTLFQQFVKTSSSVQRLSEQLKAAQGAAEFISKEIAEKYKLNDGDAFDMATGTIKRAKRTR